MPRIHAFEEAPNFSDFGADLDLPVECPKCYEKFQVKLGWFEDHSDLPCPHCKESLGCDAEKFRASLENFRNAVYLLWRSTCNPWQKS